MYIAICDSDTDSRTQLAMLIREAMCAMSASYQIREYGRVRDLVYDIQDGRHADVVLADIGTTKDWEALLQLRHLCFEGFLILTADSAERAVDGYALEADGYLLKPLEESRVNDVITRLCTRARKACMTVFDHARIVRIPYHDILYIESRNARCIIHRVQHEDYTMYTHLDDLEKELHDDRFLRCHQSYLVNMDHVIQADTAFVMSNGDVVAIRQRERKRLRDRFCCYLARDL